MFILKKIKSFALIQIHKCSFCGVYKGDLFRFWLPSFAAYLRPMVQFFDMDIFLTPTSSTRILVVGAESVLKTRELVALSGRIEGISIPRNNNANKPCLSRDK